MSASLYALFVGATFLVTKIGIERGSALETLSYRFLFAFIGIFIFLKIKGVKINYAKRPFKPLMLISFFYAVGFFGFQAFGMVYITTIESSIIFAVVPILTLILASVFLKEKHNWKQYISVVLSAVGVISIFAMKAKTLESTNALGLLFVSLSSLSLAGYSVYARWLRDSFSPIEISYFMMLFGTVFYQGILLGTSLYQGDFSAYASLLTDWKFVISVIYLGVLTTFVTSILSTYALSKLPAVQMSVFGNLATVIAIGIGVLILGEPLNYYHIVGTLLILVGVLGTNFLSTKSK